MLKQLYIKNFILFDEIDLDFNRGFTVVTGETGAGKSIMMDALSVLSGDRASASLIRKGQSKAIIEGIFDFSRQSEALALLADAGIDADSEEVILTREIREDGKSICRVNSRLVNVSLLKSLLEDQLDIHSQHDTQYLLRPTQHLRLLDRYVNENELLNEVKEAYRIYDGFVKEKAEALKQEYSEDAIAMYEYEIDEIESAHLTEGEDDALRAKEKEIQLVAKHLDKIHQAISLYDESLQDQLSTLSGLFNGLSGEFFDKLNENVNNAYEVLEDNMSELRNYLDHAEYSEEEINSIQERLFLINRLKRKYGGSISAILEYAQESRDKLEQMQHRQEYIDSMDRKIKEAEIDYVEKAEQLHMLRVKKANKLDAELMEHLKDLMLPNAVFKTHIQKGHYQMSGYDNVEFMISLNPGEDLKPLAKVASGGELSRLMLGLKTIFTSLNGIETIIFDEIDTGVSGPVATAIGKKMKLISKNTQLFAITHLAQVASFADTHYFVHKSFESNKTTTEITELNRKEVIEQLALISAGN
ncbi:MAG: DNA repair protein RecN, partial [Erysipelotrichaceae bacterium]|nr:DNA repair protein RecN [Erysipelotrichaceae bacterium]